MDKFKNILQTLRILDRDGVVSLSNILVYSVLLTPFLGIFNIYYSISIVVLYGSSRWINYLRGQVIDKAMKKILENQVTMKKEIIEMQSKVNGVSIKAGIKDGRVCRVGLRNF